LTHRPHVSAVVEGDIGQDDTFPVVETNVEIPFLPVDGAAVQLETDTLWLSHVDRLEIISEANLPLNEFMIEVSRRRCVERSAFLRNVDMDDLLCLDVEDRTEIKRVGVLKIINAGSVVHQSLLKSGSISVALIVAC
jgi:hypothetical protein